MEKILEMLTFTKDININKIEISGEERTAQCGSILQSFEHA